MAGQDAIAAEVAAGATIVTANQRLARALGLRYNRQQRDAGHRTWPSPAILAWDDWIQRLWAQSEARDGVAARATLLGPAELDLVWAQVVSDERLGSGMAGARQAQRAREICANWLIETDALRAAARGGDQALFADWLQAFESHLRTTGLADRAEALRRLPRDLAGGLWPAARRIALAGPDDWPPARRAFLHKLAAAGAVISELPMPRVTPIRHRRVRCLDAAAEIDAAARWARAQATDRPDARVAIIVPDLDDRWREVRRAVLDVIDPGWRLEPAALPSANLSVAGTLADSGIARSGLLVLRLLEPHLDYRDACALLRSPYLAGHEAEAAARAQIENRLRERIGFEVTIDELVAATATAAPRLAAGLGAIAERRRGLPSRQPLGSWLETFRAALAAVGWPGERPLASDDFQALTAWGTLGGTLGRCNSLAGQLGLTAALQFLERAAADRPFQPAGSDDAIQVLGVMEALGQSFDSVWVTGLVAADWPPAVRPQALIPLELQRRAGLPECSPQALLDASERRLAALLAGAAVVVLSSPEFSGDEPVAASALIDDVPACEIAELSIWSGPTPWQVAAASLESAGDVPPALPATTRLRGGASLIGRQSACPARAFLEDRLGARELGQPSAGIDGAQRGQITHYALAALYRRVTSSDELGKLGADALDALLGEVLEAALRANVPSSASLARPLIAIERSRQLAMLNRLLVSERERAAFRILRVEASPGEGRLPASLAALGLGLRVDRIDELASGERVVIDYKTGSRKPSTARLHEIRLPEPQLPLYALASEADAVAWIQLRSRGVSWVGTGAEGIDLQGIAPVGKRSSSPFSDWDSLRAHWWHTLERLAAEFSDGDFRINRWHTDLARGEWAMATRVYDAEGDDGLDGEEGE